MNGDWVSTHGRATVRRTVYPGKVRPDQGPVRAPVPVAPWPTTMIVAWTNDVTRWTGPRSPVHAGHVDRDFSLLRGPCYVRDFSRRPEASESAKVFRSYGPMV